MSTLTTITDDLIIQNKKQKKTDLQLFIEKYKPSKFKEMRGRIEVRSVSDLNGAMNKARETIKEYNMALVVVCDAEMSAYRAFEVREV